MADRSPPVRDRARPNAKYVSQNRQEYYIKQIDQYPFYEIRRYRGGLLNKKLKGRFTSYKRAEEILVNWIKYNDVNKTAVYPDKYRSNKNNG